MPAMHASAAVTQATANLLRIMMLPNVVVGTGLAG
jgi:hypothetical protein